jgi:hypothetical protein
VKINEAIERARAAAEALRAEYPDIEDDADLWDTSIESMTDALDVADWLVGRALDREAMADAAKVRAEALRDRSTRFAKSAKSAKAAALAIYDSAGLKKRETVEFSVSIRAGQPSVIVTDAAALPDEMLRCPPPEPDKAALKAALLAGSQIPGAELSNAAPFLTIRTR